MLSQENIDKLIMTGLYSHAVPEPGREYGSDPRWCKNWTFTVHEYDGIYRMRDTYWSSGDSLSFELTDENFDEFTLILDFEKVNKTNRAVWLEYDENKRFWAPTDSGGTYCGGTYFVLKDAKPSKAKKREILAEKIDEAARQLDYKKRELSRLDAGDMDDFYE